MNTKAEAVLLSTEGAVATITLNRPAVLNAIDLPMAERLADLLYAVAEDDAVRAVILTGNGRGFCAGGDLRFALAANPEQPGDSFAALVPVLNGCIEALRTMDKPTLAAINGPAAGAGLFLALACDLRIMSESAYLKQSNSSFGLTTPAGGSFLLPRLLGMGRALEVVMLDAPISSLRALDLGLISAAHPDERLMQRAHELAARVQAMPVGTLGQMKRLMNEAFGSSLAQQLAKEQEAVVASANSLEGREGLTAFVQKRHPTYGAARAQERISLPYFFEGTAPPCYRTI